MIIDIIALLLVSYGAYQGFSRGLIKTLFATVSLIIGVVAALKLSPLLMDLLESSLGWSRPVAVAVGLVATFILVMFIIRFVGDKVEKLFEAVQLGILNKLAGAALLGGFYALLVSFGVFVVDQVGLVGEETKRSSITYPFLEPLPQAARGVGESLKPLFTDFWDKMLETMDEIKDKGEELQEG